MIEFHGVTKRFDEKLILDHADCRIAFPGKTALIGASGMGKTTVARMLLGLDRDYSGRIAGIPAKKACVFQEDRLLMQLTAEQNVRFVKPDISEEALSEGFDRLGLAQDRHTPVNQLSGGMKRRVSILRALLSDAEMIIMDEPMKGLDEAIARSTAQYCRERTEGRLLLYITHDFDEITWMGIDRTIRLEGGKLI